MRHRYHRQFGLPNANQILLCIASWDVFCADDSFQMRVPKTNHTTTVVNMQDGVILCYKRTNGNLVPELMVWMLAVGLSCALLSTLLAVYLQLGNPTRGMVFWIGTMPGILLFGSAVLGTASLFLWQRYYLRFNNGDCFSITVAATVIAYAAAISMVIRWRWPGICAVPNEQQVIGSRLYGDHLPPRRGRRQGSAGVTATVNNMCCSYQCGRFCGLEEKVSLFIVQNGRTTCVCGH
ncbi:unnamed protein product [Peronospora belbahrii]|uniref:Uncharacterized protein n=1 Tax=Peronospora belbahrii TaxID=622444 RepID=A0ABN8D444_9STRA|nr:unnamed protein product [Peronospora belbahrii]